MLSVNPLFVAQVWLKSMILSPVVVFPLLLQHARRSLTPYSTQCGLWAAGRTWTVRDQRATARERRKTNCRAALLFITVTTWVIYSRVVLALFKGIVSLLKCEIVKPTDNKAACCLISDWSSSYFKTFTTKHIHTQVDKRAQAAI